MESLKKRFWAGEPAALGRVISIIENDEPGCHELMSSLSGKTGRAYVLGVTGSPGAGKSSLVDKLTSHLRKQGNSVGIIAVDPTSPFSSGALLGDRIRMQNHAGDPGVFIRSMATRGSMGGLSYSTKEAVKAMDAFGFDWVIVETVGVGQIELDIMDVADTVVVVLTPGAGDSIQSLKAGIMEIANVYAVNKSDIPGADQVVMEVESILSLKNDVNGWLQPVVKTSAVNKDGLDELLAAVQKHRAYITENGLYLQLKEKRLKQETLEILQRLWQSLVYDKAIQPGEIMETFEAVGRRQIDPHSAARSIFGMLTKTVSDNKCSDI